MIRRFGPLALALALAAGLPLLSLVGGAGAVADPLSELPVKLWTYETFARVGLLGGNVDTIGFPGGGALNNPDPVGTIVTALARPAVGRLGAYDVLIYVQLLANMAAMAALAWEVTRARGAALFAAVCFGLTPLTLVYGVASAVTDLLSLWPYALAFRSGLRALRRPGWADALLAGAWAGLGLVTCPYNALVLSILAVPLAAFLPAWWRGGAGPVAEARSVGSVQLLRAAGGVLLGVAVVGGGEALALREVTQAPRSLMRAEDIVATRPAPPYTFLEPLGRDRYVALLADYVAVGKGALVVRDNASRYYRAFSPGLVALGLAGAGLVLQRRRVVVAAWLTAAAFAALASTGPFLPLTGAAYASTPINPVWLGLHHLWPGADLLLEPFRYGLGVALGVAMAAAFGVEALARRWGGWVGPAATVAWLAELVILSPVPVPLPTTTLPLSPGWEELDAALPPGAIVALPYYVDGADLLNRTHFFGQLVHGRPIPDEVIGTVPPVVGGNAFLSSLLLRENAVGRLHVTPPSGGVHRADRPELARAGFVALVVDPAGYRPDTLDSVLRRLRATAEPTRVGDLYVFPLHAAP